MLWKIAKKCWTENSALFSKCAIFCPPLYHSINGNELISRIQIGQPHDLEVSDVTVVNLTAENTGDDSLALFNVVQDAKISNCYIRYRVLMVCQQPIKCAKSTLGRWE